MIIPKFRILRLTFLRKPASKSLIRQIIIMVSVLKSVTVFSFCSQIIKDGIHRMLARTANREDPDQTASSEAV